MNTLGVRGEVTPTSSSSSSIYSYICADNTQLSFDREQSWHEMVRAAVDTTREAARSMRGCATIEIVGNSKIMGTANEIEMANQSWQRAAVADRKLSFYGD